MIMERRLILLSENSGLTIPKPQWKKKRKRHKQSILNTEKGTCFLCARLHNDHRQKYTEDHHILFGSGQRDISEAEGLKVDLCLDHHRAGPEAVHNNQEMRELLCRIVQEEYEKSHTREECMEISRKNYLE